MASARCDVCRASVGYNDVTLVCADRFAGIVLATLCTTCLQPWRDAHPIKDGPGRYEWRPSTKYPGKYNVYKCTVQGDTHLLE